MTRSQTAPTDVPAAPPPSSVDPAGLRIVHHPDPVLRAATGRLDPADPAVAVIARRMIELMHEAEGVGLAAPQVGLSWRLFVTNAGEADPVDRAFVNPVLDLHPGGEAADNPLEPHEEGCLSLPGINGVVRRPRRAVVRATDLEGHEVEMDAEGFLARVWQHEFDHLEGVLIIDRFGPRDRLANRRALRDLEGGR